MSFVSFAFWLFQKTVLPLFVRFLQRCRFRSYTFKDVDGKTVKVEIFDIINDITDPCSVCSNSMKVDWEKFPYFPASDPKGEE